MDIFLLDHIPPCVPLFPFVLSLCVTLLHFGLFLLLFPEIFFLFIIDMYFFYSDVMLYVKFGFCIKLQFNALFFSILITIQVSMSFCGCSWCHRIFPIQATCRLDEKELHEVVTKLVVQFVNNEQNKFARPIKVLVFCIVFTGCLLFMYEIHNGIKDYR